MPKLAEHTERIRAETFLGHYFAGGCNAVDAYVKTYKCSVKGARMRAHAKLKETEQKGYKRAFLLAGELTPEWVLRNLRDIAETAPKNSDRIACLTLIGKSLAMWVDRSEVKDTTEKIAGMSEEELNSRLRKKLREMNEAPATGELVPA